MTRTGARRSVVGFGGGRGLLGMPGPVWTMALWFAISTVLLTVSFIAPMSTGAKPGSRWILIVYGIVVIAILLTLRGRTPRWFLFAQTAVAMVAGLWLTYISVTPVGAVTSAFSLVAVAAYAGFWMEARAATAYVLTMSMALLVVLGLHSQLPALLVPWALISALSVGLVASYLTILKQINEQLVTDPLTGLVNRAGLFGTVEADRVTAPRCIVVIDLDGFKALNDSQGHQAGDDALRAFGDAVRSVARPSDIAFRSGGDEFVLLLPSTDLEAAQKLTARLREVTALKWSHGVSEWSVDEPFDRALARADRLMYQRKTQR